jgi:hypothetical protein
VSTSADDYFPTSENQEDISAECAVHQVIAACGRYCELVDHDWAKIADWYQLDEQIRKGVAPEKLYGEWRARSGAADA